MPAIALGALSYPFIELLLTFGYSGTQVTHVMAMLMRAIATAIPVALASALLVMLAAASPAPAGSESTPSVRCSP